MSIVDNLSLGLSTTAIGMLVVFFGLIILIGCIYLLTVFTRRAKQQPAKEEAKATKEAPAEAEDETDDDELVAVITAAIAAVWDKPSSGFVVRRVRRADNGSARARAARENQIYSRL